MNPKYLFLLSILCVSAKPLTAAEIYRWVDERGVTQYSEKPPENRPSKLVNARPAAASVDAEGKLLEPPKAVTAPTAGAQAKPATPPAPQTALVPPAGSAPATPAVRGMAFGVYMHLRRGMTEGEVLLRAGKPDQETVEGGRNFVVKSLYYYPTLSDPFITVITLRGGRVAELERKQKTF